MALSMRPMRSLAALAELVPEIIYYGVFAGGLGSIISDHGDDAGDRGWGAG